MFAGSPCVRQNKGPACGAGGEAGLCPCALTLGRLRRGELPPQVADSFFQPGRAIHSVAKAGSDRLRSRMDSEVRLRLLLAFSDILLFLDGFRAALTPERYFQRKRKALREVEETRASLGPN